MCPIPRSPCRSAACSCPVGAGSPPGAQGPGLCFHPLGSQLLIHCLLGLFFLGLSSDTSWVNTWEWRSCRKGALGEWVRYPMSPECPIRGQSLTQKYRVRRGRRWQLRGRATGKRRAPRLFPAGGRTREHCTGMPGSPEPGPGDAQDRDPSPAESCCQGTGFKARHKTRTGTAQLCLHQGTPSAPLKYNQP